MGNLLPKRDFTYVEDTCSAFEKLLKFNSRFGEIINIGSDNIISIKELVTKIKKKMKSNVKIISTKERIRKKKTEVNYLRCNNTKAKKLLNWKPKYNFDKGLDMTIDWFYKNYEKYSDTKNYKK